MPANSVASGMVGDGGEDPSNTTVFVGGIDAVKVTEETLREHFSPFGEVRVLWRGRQSVGQSVCVWERGCVVGALCLARFPFPLFSSAVHRPLRRSVARWIDQADQSNP